MRKVVSMLFPKAALVLSTVSLHDELEHYVVSICVTNPIDAMPPL